MPASAAWLPRAMENCSPGWRGSWRKDVTFTSRPALGATLAWIGPPTDGLIVAAAEEKRPILLVPVAFVSEHSETLVELDIDYRKLAEAHGGEVYIRVPTVGTHPAFIAGLAHSIREAREADAPVIAIGRRCPAASGRCPQLAMLHAPAN